MPPQILQTYPHNSSLLVLFKSLSEHSIVIRTPTSFSEPDIFIFWTMDRQSFEKWKEPQYDDVESSSESGGLISQPSRLRFRKVQLQKVSYRVVAEATLVVIIVLLLSAIVSHRHDSMPKIRRFGPSRKSHSLMYTRITKLTFHSSWEGGHLWKCGWLRSWSDICRPWDAVQRYTQAWTTRKLASTLSQ